MTRDEEILCHSLGLQDHNHAREYRNYYCAGVGDIESCDALVSHGLMVKGRNMGADWGQYYHVADKGKAVARKACETDFPPLSRSQRRYLRFLDAKDAYPDLTFREFWRMEAASEDRISVHQVRRAIADARTRDGQV